MQECSLADVEEMAYTGRQLNSLSTGVQCFNIVVFCSVSQQHIIQEGIKKCFDSAEIAYCYRDGTSEEESMFIAIANVTYVLFRSKKLCIMENIMMCYYMYVCAFRSF